MENVNIMQTFKVQWLTSTLKFIKDDSQLLKEYPQMPSSHVEYLHNLIWHRKNHLGLGFKSLYSPVWEAMRIYSVKYQFKITVEKSKDGRSGHLIMEKIPKNVTDKNKEEENEKINPHQCEPKNTQPEKELPKKEHQKKKPKKMPKASKGYKRFLENKKILETLSPLFVKTSLKLFFYYISDDTSVTKTFPGLAPSESTFLTNILALVERRNDFEMDLSPLCNEILSDIADVISSIDFRLDITSEVDTDSNKREVTFTKVPIHHGKKKAKKLLKGNIENFNDTHNENLKSYDSPQKLIEKNNISNDHMNEKELECSAKSKHRIDPNVSASEQQKTIDNVVNFINNLHIDTKLKHSKTSEDMLKDNKSAIPLEGGSVNGKEINNETKNEQTKDNIQTTNNETLNKIVSKKFISFEKEVTTEADEVEYKTDSHKVSKTKIFQDMSVPVTINKAERMMRLMGWKGGALGLRGNGITEPIIPIANYKCSGLGHVQSKKENKEQIKIPVFFEFSEAVFCMIYNQLEKKTLSNQKKFTDDEIKFWAKTIDAMNKRTKIKRSIRDADHIIQMMKENPDVYFSIDFSDNDMNMVITKITFAKATQERIENSKDAIKAPEQKTKFKKFLLESIKQLLESGQNEKLLNFDDKLQPKQINCSFAIIQQLNDRMINPQIRKTLKSPMISLVEMLDQKKFYLSAKINSDETKMVITKITFDKATQERIEKSEDAIKAPEKKTKFKKNLLESIKQLLESGRNEKLLNFDDKLQPNQIKCSFTIIQQLNDRTINPQIKKRLQNSMTSLMEMLDQKKFYLSARINSDETSIRLCVTIKQETENFNNLTDSKNFSSTFDNITDTMSTENIA